jgi:CxxC-x17-CxxC domain-containing protein
LGDNLALAGKIGMGLHPEQDVIYFGRTNFRNQNRLFGIKRNDRRQHTYVVGKTGTGKSALLSNMIIQDIANGEGVCIVDPHGELIEQGILPKIPQERLDDVIYFNPADTDFHIGFNVLELPDPKYKHLVASGLMGIFTKIWSNVWSARMEYILNNAVLALLDTPGSTLLGIPRILVDKDYRQKIIANITDPVVKAFWVNEYEQWQERFRNEAIAPIQNKVGQFLSTSIIRNVVGQAKSTIDIFQLMNEGRIFLVNVSKGRIGEDNSALLGAMLITKIQLAAMERVRVPEDERVDFYLYVDEFQNFATDSFAGILSEARKYRLNLTLAHQYIGQLVTEVSTKVRDAIFGNVGTMILFRVGAADAEFLESEFEPEFTIQDIVNLPNYCVYLKLMVDGITCRPFSAMTLPPFKVKSSVVATEEIIENSRSRYARPRQVVEEEINAWSGIMTAESTFQGPLTEAGVGEGGRFRATCSNCGKNIMLSFEPTPGRPVYCKSCLARVKSGEIPSPARQASIRSRQRYSPDLANLGIEFALRRESPVNTRSPLESALSRKDITEVVRTPTAKPMSLGELKPVEKSERIHHGHNEINIAELQREIAASLGKGVHEPPPQGPR